MWPSIGSEVKPQEKCCGPDDVKTFWLTISRRSPNNSAITCLSATLSTKYSTCIARKLNCVLSRWEAVIWPAEIPDSQSHLLKTEGNINHLATVSVSSTLTVMCQSSSATEVGSAPQGHAFSKFPIDAVCVCVRVRACVCVCACVWRVCKIAKSDYWLPLVRPPAWKNSAPTVGVFMKFMFEYFRKICRENSSLMKISRE